MEVPSKREPSDSRIDIEYDVVPDFANEPSVFTCVEKFMVGLYVVFVSWWSFCLTQCTIEQYETGFLFRYGKSKTGSIGLAPGLRMRFGMDDLYRVDMRRRVFDMPAQDLITFDGVTIKLDGVLFWNVVDPWKALMAVSDYERATTTVALVYLRNYMGSETLSAVLHDRTTIAAEITKQADKTTRRWGVQITSVQVNDISLPHALQSVMAAEAEATRHANAKIMLSEGELKSSKILSEAAIELEKAGPTAMAISHLNSIANMATSTRQRVLICPVPLDTSETTARDGFNMAQRKLRLDQGLDAG